MALSQAELNFVRKAQNVSRILLDQRQAFDELNVFWAGAPNYDSSITQQDLDENFPDSGLTVLGLADSLYAMELIKTNVNNAMVPFVILGNIP